MFIASHAKTGWVSKRNNRCNHGMRKSGPRGPRSRMETGAGGCGEFCESHGDRGERRHTGPMWPRTKRTRKLVRFVLRFLPLNEKTFLVVSLLTGQGELQVPPLRCAPVGMTKFNLVAHLIICYVGSRE